MRGDQGGCARPRRAKNEGTFDVDFGDPPPSSASETLGCCPAPSPRRSTSAAALALLGRSGNTLGVHIVSRSPAPPRAGRRWHRV